MTADADAQRAKPAWVSAGSQMAWLLRGLICAALIVIVILGFSLDPWLLPTRYRLCGLLLGAVIVLSLHPATIACAFVAARICAGPLPKEERLGMVRALQMFDREIDASMRGAVWANPFAFTLPAPRPVEQARGTALLFIHGYFCNRGVWRSTMLAAARTGFVCEAITLEPPFASIDQYREPIAKAIEALLAQEGIDDVVLVAHSMGALAARSLLGSRELPQVRKLICLGAPHHGTLTASLGRARNTQQMRRDSLWLTNLNGLSRFPRQRIVSIYSVHDDVVFPWHTSHLEGADNRRLSGIGHVSLLYHPEVQRLVLDCAAS